MGLGALGAVSVFVVLGAGACSSNKSRTVEDARRVTPPSDDAPVNTARPHDDAGAAPGAPTGDVQVRVAWPNAPAAVRSSPGKTACGTPRTPAVSPSTTWGIGAALVIVDGAPETSREARVRWLDCALVPRLVVGEALVIDSAADRPASLVLAHAAAVNDLRAGVPTPDRRTVLLPVAGHQVSAMLESGAVYRLAAEGKTSEPAWIVAGPGAITDANGVVLVRDVPVGVHAVRAWLPPRGGQPARHAAGEVTVASGELAELTLELAP